MLYLYCPTLNWGIGTEDATSFPSMVPVPFWAPALLCFPALRSHPAQTLLTARTLTLAWDGVHRSDRAILRRSARPGRWVLTPVCACTQRFSPPRKIHVI